jgi:2-polyprenyl-3-methyl-5-hydroxy-6-metoxy-1,4-benzoquinol methylase
MAIYASEITSEKHIADNPIHQRLLKAYYEAMPFIKGDLLEVGCGEGRGVELLAPLASSYSAIDKIGDLLETIKTKHPEVRFYNMNVPPFEGISSESYDTVVSFQVIEHIENDRAFLEEIHRVLKPSGKAIISTPNISLSLTRNPWHVREYTASEFTSLCKKVFSKVSSRGITGNEKVLAYYEKNKQSVQKYKKLDIFNLEQKLPASILRIPYDILNRMNRNKLRTAAQGLVDDIGQEDFFVTDTPETTFDLFYILEK